MPPEHCVFNQMVGVLIFDKICAGKDAHFVFVSAIIIIGGEQMEISPDMISRAACTNYDSFCRFFSYITGMTLSEYIRKRRLTKAAYDLRQGGEKIIDIAVKYGYSGADAFARAFVRQHGIPPAAAKDISAPLKIYPPVSFHIIFKGAKEMNMRIIETKEIEVYGISREFGGGAAERFEQEHTMWSNQRDDVPSQICDSFEGVWFGIWDHGRYMIARDRADVTATTLERYVIPAGKYAAFTTKKGGFAGNERPALRDLIFNSWMPDSEYVQNGDMEIEVYHLFGIDKVRKKERYYEIWVPIKER